MTSNHPTDFQIEAAILEDKIPDAWKNDPQIASQISAYQNAQQDFWQPTLLKNICLKTMSYH